MLSDKERHHINQKLSLKNAKMNYVRWTEEEDEFIRTCGLSTREMATRLKRTYSSVTQRRHKLNKEK